MEDVWHFSIIRSDNTRAFGDPMKPTVQGLLGPDKLQAVLVPGMKDDIYYLCQLLQPNHRTGTSAKISPRTGLSLWRLSLANHLYKRQLGKGPRHILPTKLEVFMCYAMHQQLWQHCHRLTLLHTPHISMVCIRGIRGTVSADCRWTSNLRTVYVSKL